MVFVRVCAVEICAQGRNTDLPYTMNKTMMPRPLLQSQKYALFLFLPQALEEVV